jgi:hypothetical protein
LPEAIIRPHPEGNGLVIARPGKGEATLFLDNIFAETRDMDPPQRQERIDRFVRTLGAATGGDVEWEEARPRLAPLLRGSTMFVHLATVDRHKWPIRRPFVPFLVECVGLDSDEAIAYVSADKADSWGVTPSQVYEAAADNGASYFTDDIAPYDASAPYPLWHVARDDSYETSRLLVPGWLASFAGKVSGRPVAIVPARSLLVVGGDGDDRCLRRMIDTAKAEYQGSPRRVSPALYTVDDAGKVVPLVLPPSHPLAELVAEGHLMLAVAEYQIQKADLEKRLGDGVFVATYQAFHHEKRGFVTVSSWAKGVETLLPETGEVVVGDPAAGKSGSIVVPWDALMQHAGHCLRREPDVEPPRWRTIAWPDEAALAKLRASATSRLGE